jgi:hypothetical protein
MAPVKLADALGSNSSAFSSINRNSAVAMRIKSASASTFAVKKYASKVVPNRPMPPVTEADRSLLQKIENRQVMVTMKYPGLRMIASKTGRDEW